MKSVIGWWVVLAAGFAGLLFFSPRPVTAPPPGDSAPAHLALATTSDDITPALALASTSIPALPASLFASTTRAHDAPAAAPKSAPSPRTIPTITSTKQKAPAATTTSSTAHSTPPIVTAPVQSPAPTPALAPAPVDTGLSENAAHLRGALVNIICLSSADSGIRSTSGSGVIVSSAGVILTNAHIAQYFLLNNYPSPGSVNCTIRTGGPAKDTYAAKLMFISPSWVAFNADTLTQAAPTGTGEYDFALLAITKSLTSDPLPTRFSFVPLAASAPAIGDSVVIGSYAAQFLSTQEILSSLYPTIVYGSIKDRYTFTTDTVDLISLGGTAAAQEGSSGGGAINDAGELVGTITTSTTEGATQNRDLRAITASYIRRDYAQEMGTSLDSVLTQTPSTVADAFATRMPALTATLVQALSTAH
ncbi:MAG TPA: serine protease [Candidatus Paceibacterota bacterium]